MKMSLPKCYFKSIDNIHNPIELVHGEERVLGRGPETRIKDSRCSRKQLKIVADCEKKEAKVTQMGRNSCGLNGMALSKDYTVTITEKDRIEMLLGQFVHIIEFESPSSDEESEDPEKTPESLSKANRDQLSSSEEEPKESEPKSKRRKKTSDSGNSSKASVSNENWESVDGNKLLVYTHPDVKPSSLISAYDLDSTIIATRSGSVFPKHKDDWKIMYPEVLFKLKEMHDKNYKIIIFTNQNGITTGKTNENDIKKKIEDVVKKISLPIQVFVATGISYYRKPLIGMWEAAMERNGGLQVDLAKSSYCGDAAGREAGPTQKKKDFSCSDLLFAKNLNLRFETPEHHFLNKEMQPLKITVFDPKTIPCDIPLCSPAWGQVISNKTEIIILVGCPASGKTNFVKTHLISAGYVHVNRDILGSWNRCVSVMETALRSRQKVVVDNTNPDVESRKRYINVARNYTPFIRCFIMNTSLNHAKHNNKFRQLTDPSHAVVSDAVINMYNSKYKEPTLEEGFTEILRINFWPTFKNPEHEKLYRLFLLEK